MSITVHFYSPHPFTQKHCSRDSPPPPPTPPRLFLFFVRDRNILVDRIPESLGIHIITLLKTKTVSSRISTFLLQYLYFQEMKHAILEVNIDIPFFHNGLHIFCRMVIAEDSFQCVHGLFNVWSLVKKHHFFHL